MTNNITFDVRISDLMSKFEGYTPNECAYHMGVLLRARHYSQEKKPGRRGTYNEIYTSPTSDYVFVIVTKEGASHPVLLDKDLYEREIRPLNKSVITFSECSNNNSKIRFEIWKSGKMVKLHRLPFTDAGYKVVDHITHNTGIDIVEYLRPCTDKENKWNKKFFSKIKGNYFSIPSSVISSVEQSRLESQGYKIRKKDVRSPKFNTYREMKEALKALEEKVLGEYRYNPLLDFSETGYALFIHKLLGLGTEEELKEYNRSYMKRNHPDIAEYYDL